MKWTTIFYTFVAVCFLTAQAAETRGQVNFDTKLSLKERKMSLRASLREISRQTGVDFAYSSRNLPLNQSIQWSGDSANLREVMDTLASEYGIHYEEVGNSLVLLPRTERPRAPEAPQYTDIREFIDPSTQQRVIEGRVLDAQTGEPIEGATVTSERTGISTRTDKNGYFRLVLSR